MNNEQEEIKTHIMKDKTLFPRLSTMSSGFAYNTVPNPVKRGKIELISLNEDKLSWKNIESRVSVHQWNNVWEMGQLRAEFFEEKLPDELKYLNRYTDRNVYLIPKIIGRNYNAYASLHHLLPESIIKKFNLPLFENYYWPTSMIGLSSDKIKSNYDKRLSKTFASYI